jgi:TonB family protein
VKIPVSIASALAIHAAAAVGMLALGSAHGKGAAPAIVGETTIEVDEEPHPVLPVVHEDHVEAPVATTVKESSRGAPSTVNVLARAATTSTASTDSIPEPPPVQTAAPMHFKMSSTMSSSSGSGGASSHVQTTAASVEEVAVEADVSERAAKLGGVAPAYPSEALAQGVELGSPLPFEIVVDTSGHVVSERPLRHAGYGFDEAAAAALRTYRFSPAKRNGHAVAVRMKWTVDFRFN